MKPYQGKYRESYEKRAKLMNMLKPYGISKYQLQALHNPAKGTVKMHKARRGDTHVVPLFVSFNKTKVFEYRGRLYDASKMPVSKRSQIMRMME